MTDLTGHRQLDARIRAVVAGVAVAVSAMAGGPAQAAPPDDDLVFMHHSCGYNWLSNSLNAALVAKDYIDERNDIYYGTDMTPDAGRPDSLASTPGDTTDMHHWIRWFNDYLGRVKAHGCASGVNRIVMFKSCYPISNIDSDGTEPGDPFSDSQTLANYRAVYRHPSGSGTTYSNGGYDYKPLEDIFAENPDTLFIAVTAPPLVNSATTDANGHRARVFNTWLKTEWLAAYNAAHPGLNNVAVFDWFDVLANPDDAASNPNRLKAEYGGSTGDSHPVAAANAYSTQVFATNPGNFIDAAWQSFDSTAAAISGYARRGDGSPLDGVAVTLSGAAGGTCVTAADGSYCLPGLSRGCSYTLVPARSGWSFTPQSLTIASLNSDVTNQNFIGAPAAAPEDDEDADPGDDTDTGDTAPAGTIRVLGSADGRGTVNPARGQTVRIQFDGAEAGVYVCRVFTTAGEQVWESASSGVSEGAFEWFPGDAASGIYIIHVTGPGLNRRAKAAVVR